MNGGISLTVGRRAHFILTASIFLLLSSHAMAIDSQTFIQSVMQNKVQEVEGFIQDGANVNTRGSDDGNTGLHWAASLGLVEMAELLVSNGAHVNRKNREGNTPLHWAAGQGNLEIVKILMTNGADINANGKLNWTPLRWAEETGHTDIADILRSAGARR